MRVVVFLVLVLAVMGDVPSNAPDGNGFVKARIVQNVKVFLNPNNVVQATIVKHLPSADTATKSSNADMEVIGDAFETSNFEAEEVAPEDSLVSDNVELVDPPRFAAPETPPSMTSPAPAADKNDANVDPTVPVLEKLPAVPLDEAAKRASTLYLGYEPPGLPVGGLKRAVDYSGTIGTEAGNDFNYAKALAEQKNPPKKPAKCANGCTRKVPVMVGYVGLKEQPATSTRSVRVPGDQKRYRRIHQDLKTTDKITWAQEALDTARSHLSKSARRLKKLRKTRKVLEDTQLNRHAVLP